jgi:HK97 family phage major capsid protein
VTESEMRAASKAALDAARVLADTAAAENRDFTDAEKTDYAAKLGEVRSLDQRVARAEELRTLNAGRDDRAPLKTGADDNRTGEAGLTAKETSKFSIVRLMRALSNPADRAAQAAAAFELEASAAAARKLGDSGSELRGVSIPREVLNAPSPGHESRALTVGTATAGGNTVATNLLAGSFIEVLRNRLSIMQAGATMLNDLIGFVAIPRQTGAASTSWVTEGTAPGGASAQTFDQVPLSPKTLAVYVDASRRLLLQSSIDIEAFIRNDIAAQMALGIDYAALNGPGTGGSPKGVLQTSGIGSVAHGANGGAMAWADWVALETQVAIANADVSTMSYITNASQRGTAKSTARLGNTSGIPIWDGNEVNGYRAIASNQVPGNLTKGTGSNLSAVLFGNFADLIVGMWGGLDMIVDPYTSSTTGTVRFVALQDVDVALRRLASFAAVIDAV